jgi:hypothetical protein
MNRTKTATLAVTLGTAASVALAAPPAAQAAGARAGAPARCAADSLCAYAGAGYTGAVSTFAFHHSATRSEPALTTARSLYNNVPLGTDEQGRPGGWCWKVYNGENFTGRSMVIKPNTGTTVPASFGAIRSDHTVWCPGQR